MTAIAIGKTLSKQFIVVDAMVQHSLTVKNHKDCLLKDKITNFKLSEQFLVLSGEELISYGATSLRDWCEMESIQIDLLKTEHFKELLICTDKSRSYTVDVMNGQPIDMEKSDVYIASRETIKCYEVRHDGKKYFISKESYFPDNSAILNYRGEIKPVALSGPEIDLRQFGIQELIKEHEWRKSKSRVNENLPLDYDFEDRYSSVIIPGDILLPIERVYPFNDLTDMYLSYPPPIWDYALNVPFKYTPNIT